jgi:tetratricopeptide (TPR) repeat protein
MKKQLLTFGMIVLSMSVWAQSKWGATPEDSVTCIENTSLYVEFYKQNNYKDAKGPWYKAVTHCPKSSKNLYIKGASMYKTFIENQKNEDLVKAQVDTLMWIYDKRIENYGQKGFVLGRKGADLFRYDRDRYEEAYGYLKESYELEGNKMEKGAITSYYQVTEQMVINGKLEQAELLNLFPKLSDVILYNIQKEEKEEDKANWVNVEAIIQQIFSKYAGCPELVSIYKPKYEANSNDTATLIEIIALFEKSECTDDELFLNASMSLDKIKPSALSKFGIGKSLLKKERFSEAASYFIQAADLAETPQVRSTNYKYAALTYLSMKQYANAKTYALKMLSINASDAEAYMIIGDAYLYGSTTVGETECTQGGGYWAAIDKYNRAKSLDGSLAEKANKKIASCRAQFPSKNACFFENIIDGQSYHVGGWINEDVTVTTK